MFAILATIVFALVVFDVKLESFGATRMLALGLAFLAIHFVWPLFFGRRTE